MNKTLFYDGNSLSKVVFLEILYSELSHFFNFLQCKESRPRKYKMVRVHFCLHLAAMECNFRANYFPHHWP